MCDFTNMGNYTASGWQMASTGLQIAGTIGKGIAQMKAAEANNEAVQANYLAQLNQVQTQQRQVNQQAAKETGKIAMQAQAEREKLAAALGEAGVSGNTAIRLQHAIDQSANDAKTTVETNRFNRIAQSANQADALAAQANANMKDESFNWFGTGLQIATDVVQFGSTLKRKPASGRTE